LGGRKEKMFPHSIVSLSGSGEGRDVLSGLNVVCPLTEILAPYVMGYKVGPLRSDSSLDGRALVNGIGAFIENSRTGSEAQVVESLLTKSSNPNRAKIK
jgi:hypothetical protein